MAMVRACSECVDVDRMADHNFRHNSQHYNLSTFLFIASFAFRSQKQMDNPPN